MHCEKKILTIYIYICITYKLSKKNTFNLFFIQDKKECIIFNKKFIHSHDTSTN